MEVNRGWIEFAVASIILWRHIVHPVVRKWYDKNKIYFVPLENFKEEMGAFLDDTRRVVGVGSEYTEHENLIIAGGIRKMGNMIGRDLQ